MKNLIVCQREPTQMEHNHIDISPAGRQAQGPRLRQLHTIRMVIFLVAGKLDFAKINPVA